MCGRTICRTIKAIIGVRSNMPSGGTIFRMGASIGSVIWSRNWEILSSPLGDIQDIITRPNIARLSAVKRRLMN